MDSSGLIFVALAIAWAAYLVPKALRHHDEVERGRPVEGFSDGMRVLARREPVTAKKARLVVPGSSQVERSLVEPVETRATARATKRRRRVLMVILVALVAVVAACAMGRIPWLYVAAPAAVLVAWLVACRLMVRKERAARRSSLVEPVETPASLVEPVETDSTPTGKIAPITPDETAAAEGLWDPVPVTLPTYVSKPAARRSVRTIDLDSTGVWTSGRSASDSALAREADAADRVRRTAGDAAAGDEAVGS